MPTSSDIIGDILKREGPATNDPTDRGGATAYGIAKASNPDAWKNGPPTEATARAIYESKYLRGPGFDKLTNSSLQALLVDYGVNSGPAIAIQKLQTCLGVTADGVLGPITLNAANSAVDPIKLNNAIVAERLKMIARIVQKDLTQAKYLLGWISRACEFLLP